MYSGAVTALMASEWEDFLPVSANARSLVHAITTPTWSGGDLNEIGNW